MAESLHFDVSHDEATVAPPFAHDLDASARMRDLRLRIRGTHGIVAVEPQVLAHERRRVNRRDHLVAVALDREQRHVHLVRQRRDARAIGDRFDVLLRASRKDAHGRHAGFRRAARDARVYGHRRHEARKSHAEDGRHGASRRHACDVHALAVDAIAASHRTDLRGNDGGFAVAA